MFFKKEVFVSYDLKQVNEIRSMLSANGINCYTSYKIGSANGRYHGIPGINSSAAYEYRLCVKNKDYKKAISLLGR